MNFLTYYAICYMPPPDDLKKRSVKSEDNGSPTFEVDDDVAVRDDCCPFLPGLTTRLLHKKGALQ